jgi:hypothetical protein
MNATYRCKKSYVFIGILGTMFAVLPLAMLYIVFFDPPPHRELWAAIVMTPACLAVLLLTGVGGPYVVVLAIRHRLIVCGDKITSVNALGTAEIDLPCVTEARWKRGQNGGRLLLRTELTKLRIDFDNYSADAARELIRFFRFRLPEAIQTNWEPYWTFAWGFFDKPDPARREEFAAETRALRRRLAIWVSLGMIVIAAVGFFVWRSTGDCTRTLGSIGALLVILPIALGIRADRGRISDQSKAPRRVHPFQAIALAIMLATMPLGLLIMAMGNWGGRVVFYAGEAVVVASGVIAWVFAVIGCISQDARQRRARKEAARLAEQEYLQPPKT